MHIRKGRGGQNLFYLGRTEEKVEFVLFFQIDRGKIDSVASN